MYKATILNADYLENTELYFDFPCEIHFSRFGNKQHRTSIIENAHENINFKNKNSFKVFVCSNEPSSSDSREINQVIIDNACQYDLILTTEDEILNNTDNAIFFPYGTTWLNKNNHHPDSLGVFDDMLLNNISDKQYGVSFLTTRHIMKDGYELRKLIWNNKNLIKIPSLFYSSTRFPTTQYGVFSDTLHDGFLPNDDKINLFKNQFSIAIESTKEKSYFTEKLIDCLLTKTVPIYWGAPNIGDFFDVRGMIIVYNINDFYNKINSINESTYEEMKPYIEQNYIKAKEYGQSFFGRIKKVVDDIYAKQTKNTNVLWTIGILSLEDRKHYLDRLTNYLTSITPIRYKDRIQVIVNSDNKEKSVGAKRNQILENAKGKYISFIDDDDMVSLSYISKIASKLDENLYDGIGFLGIFYIMNRPISVFCHRQSNGSNYKSEDEKTQFRPLNHLNPIRTDIAKQIKYKDINRGEDQEYSDRLLSSNLINSEYFFEEVMYHYLFNPDTSSTDHGKYIVTN